MGFLYLGFDEQFQTHEFLGLNLAYVIYHDLEKDLHEYIIVGYAIIAVIILIVKFKFFSQNRIALFVIMTGILVHGLAAILDFLWAKPDIMMRYLGPFAFLAHRVEFFEVVASCSTFDEVL